MRKKIIYTLLLIIVSIILVGCGSKKLESIEISINSKIAIGDEEKATIKFKPSNIYEEISWKSSDEEIAKIDSNGIITPVKQGKVTITATSSSNIIDTKEISVKVNQTKFKITGNVEACCK